VEGVDWPAVLGGGRAGRSKASLPRPGTHESSATEEFAGPRMLCSAALTEENGFASWAGDGFAETSGALASAFAAGAPNGGILGRGTHFLDASGGGCGGRPEAIRWRGAASRRSWPIEGSPGLAPGVSPPRAGLCGNDGGLDRKDGLDRKAGLAGGGNLEGLTSDRGRADGSDAIRGHTRSRPFPPGGLFPAVTAYSPTSTHTNGRHRRLTWPGIDPAPSGPSATLRRSCDLGRNGTTRIRTVKLDYGER
jgi:hypothetical protein